MSKAGHAYWDQKVVMQHPVHGTLYGYSMSETVVDPNNPDDRWYDSDWGSYQTPHFSHEAEDSTGHPGVGYAFVRAYEATGDKFYLRAAKSLAHTAIVAQKEIGSGGWWHDIGLIGYDRRAGSPTFKTMVHFNQFMNLDPWGGNMNVSLNDQNLGSFDGASSMMGYFLLRLYQAMPKDDPNRPEVLAGAKWLADTIVGFADVVDDEDGFKPYGSGGVPQIWPYNLMKHRPGYDQHKTYPYSLPNNVMITLNDGAFDRAVCFLVEFWREAQTNPALDASVYLAAIQRNTDYLMDVFDLSADKNGYSAWGPFYWVQDGSARANRPTWGRSIEPPSFSPAEGGHHTLVYWYRYEADPTRKARIESTIERWFKYWKYSAPPVNSKQEWRDLIDPYVRAGATNIDKYDPAKINTWYWWNWYNVDESVAPRNTFVASENVYHAYYGNEALVQGHNPDSHYPAAKQEPAVERAVLLDAGEKAWLYAGKTQNQLNSMDDKFALTPYVRFFRGQRDSTTTLNYALKYFDPNTGLPKSLGTLTKNGKTYLTLSDLLFQYRLRGLAWGIENSGGAATDSDGDGYSDAEETAAGTSPLDSESYPGRGPDDQTAPSVPENLTAQAVSASQIDLNWSVSADNVRTTGYNVYRNGAWVATVPRPGYSDTRLSSNTEYTYTVSARDAAGNQSVRSQPVKAATTAAVTTTPSEAGNHPPSWESIRDRSVYVGEVVEFTVSATDVDPGDTLTYSASDMPTGAAFDPAIQVFTWTPASSQTGDHQIGFHVNDGHVNIPKTVTITVVQVTDRTAPVVQDLYPAADEVQVPLNPLIAFTIADAESGVDANSVSIRVNGQTVYAGDRAVQETAYGTCRRTGAPASYSYYYNPTNVFNFDQQVSVGVSSSDRARNAMPPMTFQFVTEMQSFGRNEPVSSNDGGAGHPAAATDSHGNIWAVWHAGQANARDIYVARRSSQTQQWDAPVRLTNLDSDQCNPTVAIGSGNIVYVAWQDNRRGNWDIYVSSSPDGSPWREPVRMTDSNDNQTNPVIAIDRANSNRVYIAWEDDRAGNRDIYVASATSSFAGKTVTRVTSDAADQTGPALVVGSNSVAYLVWTDQRNGSADVYGSSSGASAWANVPIVTGPGNQRDPAIAVEPGTSLLHMLWVDDTAGNLDIFYGTSNGLPADPISGRTIIDDSTAADQFAPAIVVAKDYQNVNHVYACWQDNRSVADSADSDLYFAEIRAGAAGTNILVGDDSANSNQGEPVLGFDEYGQPAVLWIDSRNTTAEVYAACSTYPKPEVLASALIPASQGGEVGKDPVASDDDTSVSVKIPSNASRFDTVFSIMQMRNPPSFRSARITGYEIGPSGMQFAVPVTVTIPQPGSTSGQGVPYWYNPQTGTLSQQGVTEVTNRILANGTPAISFKTTHLTTFYIVERSVDGGANGDGWGGCSLSRSREGSLFEYFLPFGALGVFMLVLKWKDRRSME